MKEKALSIYHDPVKTGEAIRIILQRLREINEKGVEKVELQNKRRSHEQSERTL